MWNLKDKTSNKKTKKKHAHRYREQTSGYQWGEGRGKEQDGKETKKYKLLCIKYISYTNILHSTMHIANSL